MELNADWPKAPRWAAVVIAKGTFHTQREKE